MYNFFAKAQQAKASSNLQCTIFIGTMIGSNHESKVTNSPKIPCYKKNPLFRKKQGTEREINLNILNRKPTEITEKRNAITHHLNHHHHCHQKKNHQAYFPLMLESTGEHPNRLLARIYNTSGKNNSLGFRTVARYDHLQATCPCLL